ncbi:HAD family hydrolase [Aquisalimonas asiatica]|uniref:HAD-superfamily subfamily IB hydrolase, TIGR01490 n=1 Tax=Aquisalimonas asiatica TaxID=406100 RepID=A0A1H8PZ52_9GAMM|nr:HAD family hydrolase [Aquisalimonas asiatica]SEO47235.1 HAD-superfamily subfamily IB hydrolase, TIGR01490 [Aquisalimonas asiatica]
MSLALFDLDNTLLVGDSDYEWNRFLIDQGALDPGRFREINDDFMAAYEDGTLDMEAFCRVIFEALSDYPLTVLEAWRERFVQDRIQDKVAPRAPDLLAQHRAHGDDLVMVTATNDFVVRPIADLLGIDTVLATRPEVVANHFTGALVGPACFREGKIWHVERYLEAQGRDSREAAANAVFYSDSHNDLPLMEWVSTPVAVDPDSRLRDCARERGWQVLSLRDQEPLAFRG